MRRSLLVVISAVVALACGRDADRLPKGIVLRARPAAPDSTLDCPRVDGAYWIQRGIAWALLVEPRLSEASRKMPWSALELRGDAREQLQLIVRTQEYADTVTAVRGRDYACAAGWLVPSGEVRLTDLAPEDSARFFDDPKAQRFAFALAGDTTGALVGRLQVTSFTQFDVWCGDGCRGFPLPWTIEHSTLWEILGPLAAPPPGVVDDDVNRRLAAEERLLEYGEQAVTPPSIERMVQAMMPPGSRILAITPEGAGHRISVLLPGPEAVEPFLGRLINTQGMRGAHEKPGYGAWRADTEPRQWQTVIWVPKEF